MPVIHDVQQRSDAWYKLRLGLVTASCFSNLIAPKTLKPSTGIRLYSAKLAGEKFSGTPDDWDGNNATGHGIEAEDQATIDYQLATGNFVTLAGFITDGPDNENSTCGCSPDGMVDDDGMIEIKGLYTQGHVANIVEHDETGECPVEYRLQVQGQLMVAERDWCDLIFYHPHLPLKIIRVLPDLELHETMLNVIKLAMEKRNNAFDLLKALAK
jgi:putative phage-type endonuclease